MFRSRVLGILVASLTAAVSLTALQEPIFRSGSDIVRVFVTATDRLNSAISSTDVSAPRAAVGADAVAVRYARSSATSTSLRIPIRSAASRTISS